MEGAKNLLNHFRIMNTFSQSIRQSAFRRLQKNKGAMAGLFIIALSIVVAIFAYFIAPDHTPYANRMILEIGGKKPGYMQRFILLKKQAIRTSFFNRLVNGKSDAYTFIPITDHFQTRDSVIVQKLIDEGVTERMGFGNNSIANNGIISKKFWIGTDKYGRDILSRLIIGMRISLSVGMITVLISLVVGITLGVLSGYYSGKTDHVIMWMINVIWSIPTLLLVFAVTLLFGKGFWQVFVAVGLTMWVNVARLVRGQVLVTKEMQYIEAGKALGFSDARIMVRHILPNILGPILVIAASNFASAIVIEAGLSFLGVGVQPPQPSWGLMIRENYNFIITQNPMIALAPGFAIMLLVLAFNLLGNGLRDALNIRGHLYS